MRFAALPRSAVLLAGLCLGALALFLAPSSWLFRDAPARGDASHASGRRYACPMFCTMDDEPGTCPVCGMDMEPIEDHGTQVRLDARQRSMAGVRTETVVRRLALYRVRALGKIRHDERREGQITAWVSGRIDKLLVDFTGVEVQAGQKIAEIYAPELVSAQEELLSAASALKDARAAEGPRAEDVLRNAEAIHAAVRRRLLLLGMPESVVQQIEDSGVARDHLEIVANVGGTVIEKRVETGDYVKTGDTLFRVVDLKRVWGMLDVFEQDAGSVFLGQEVEVEVPSLPGEVFRGRIAFVDPVLDERRRVLRVRVDLPNESGRLKPGAFIDAHVLVELDADGHVVDPATGRASAPVLLVPHSAVLDGGDRQLVYVMKQPPGPVKDGQERWPAIYEPREVRVGFRVGDQRVVLSGLAEGDDVVTRGQFLIDSQLQLTGKPSCCGSLEIRRCGRRCATRWRRSVGGRTGTRMPVATGTASW